MDRPRPRTTARVIRYGRRTSAIVFCSLFSTAPARIPSPTGRHRLRGSLRVLRGRRRARVPVPPRSACRTVRGQGHRRSLICGRCPVHGACTQPSPKPSGPSRHSRTGSGTIEALGTAGRWSRSPPRCIPRCVGSAPITRTNRSGNGPTLRPDCARAVEHREHGPRPLAQARPRDARRLHAERAAAKTGLNESVHEAGWGFSWASSRTRLKAPVAS